MCYALSRLIRCSTHGCTLPSVRRFIESCSPGKCIWLLANNVAFDSLAVACYLLPSGSRMFARAISKQACEEHASGVWRTRANFHAAAHRLLFEPGSHCRHDIAAVLVLHEVEGSLPYCMEADVREGMHAGPDSRSTVLLAILTHCGMLEVLTMLRMWPMRSYCRPCNVVECVVDVGVDAQTWKTAGEFSQPMPGPSISTDHLRLEHQTNIYDSSNCPITERGSCMRGCPAATGSATSCRY